MVDKAVIASVKRYLSALPAYGIHPRRAVLYGSFARGDTHEWSDIDLVVIAPEFGRDRSIGLRQQLWHAKSKWDHRIEPIGCGVEEWENNQSRIILEIAKREGVVIEA